MIESVAHEMMTRLGYEPHIVGVTAEPLTFTEEQIAEFDRLNKEGIKKVSLAQQHTVVCFRFNITLNLIKSDAHLR